MTYDLQDRAELYKAAFPRRSASWPHVVIEQGRRVLYATWVLGPDYRNRSGLYGAYPPGYLPRVMALFPDAAASVLHVFSGALPRGPYLRLDLVARVADDPPEFCGSVYAAEELTRHVGAFDLAAADPPYTAADAKRYGTGTVHRRLAIAALAPVVRPGGHLAWLDTCWPMHNKRQWLTVGRIMVQGSTNHRVRALTLFERVG